MFTRYTAFFIAVLIAITLPCTFLLSGCGHTQEEDTVTVQSSKEDSEPEITEAAPGPEIKEENPTAPPETVREDPTAFSCDESLFPMQFADEEGISFSLLECSYSETQGYSWTVSMENQTDSTLLFSLDKVSLDGIMCDPYWAETVASGKKAVSTVAWMPYSLEEAGLTDVTQAECTLTVYNDDDYTAPALMKETLTVCPRGEAAVSSQIRKAEDSDRVLVENDRCRITLTGIDTKGDWGYTLKLYLENLTENDLLFCAENVSLNGIMADPYWAASVAAGKKCCSSMFWGSGTLEDKGIGEVTAIELPFLVYNEADYGDIAAQETVEIEP